MFSVLPICFYCEANIILLYTYTLFQLKYHNEPHVGVVALGHRAATYYSCKTSIFILILYPMAYLLQCVFIYDVNWGDDWACGTPNGIQLTLIQNECNLAVCTYIILVWFWIKQMTQDKILPLRKQKKSHWKHWQVYIKY